MKKQMLILAVSLLVAMQPVFGEQEVPEVTGSIHSVIVYRGQALVTRTIEVDLPQGASEIIVQKLPETIVSASLNARASDGVSVSSVRYRQKDIKDEEPDELKQIKEQIKETKKQLRHAKRDRQHSDELWNLYKGLWKLTLDAANADLNRAILQPESIEKLTLHLESKSKEWHSENVELEDLRRELERQLAELNKKRQKLQTTLSKTSRQAVVFVNSENGGKKVIELNYLVREASWHPQYNLRANPAQGRVSVEYNALIHQASGEDWEGVALSLSTAAAAMEAAPPTLEPMEVELTAYGARRRALGRTEAAKDIKGAPAPQQQVAYVDISDEFEQLQQSRRRMVGKGKAAQRALNIAAERGQMLELRADKLGVEVLRKKTRKFARREGVSVTYTLGDGFSIPSRTGQELVTIAAFQSKADFLMMATPILTDYVYLQADITNDSDTILLAGPASMYRDGEFVGKSPLELVTIGEKFTAGFGVDSQVQISREFKDKKVDTLWGKRVEKYKYRIAINNYKNIAVKLFLVERIPYTEDKGIEISGFETNVALSKDADYIRTEKDKGILRWDLNLAPDTTGKKAKIVTYSYTMKYDKDKRVEAAGPSR